jgi:hypothetical protein
LNPQDEDSATVEINTAGMEHKTWDGIFKITSNLIQILFFFFFP